MSYHDRYDLIVIGSGPGGQKAAVQGAKAGLQVALIERDNRVGGACVYQGTIPSKTLREAALAIAGLKRSAGVFQFEFREDLEVASLMERLDRVLEAHNSFIDRHLKDNGIERIHGRARLSGENEIAVMGIDGSETTFEAEKIVIASGSRPRTPPGIPTDHENILDSDSILRGCPKSERIWVEA